MHRLANIRSGKPDFYPDQSIYAEYACAEFGLTFEDISAGTGVVISVASNGSRLHFGAGRCSWYPQNSATASTLASDKYLTNTILERAGLATLGGDYFFLDDRRRALRPAGHERADTLRYFRTLGASAFVKPLFGSRGDFAQVVHGEAALARYLDEVAQCYDSILIQPLARGTEYRVFLLDDEVVYTARKYPPSVSGDGTRSIRNLLVAHNAGLRSRGLSPVSIPADPDNSLDAVLPRGSHWEIPGRMNLSAGGTMVIETLGCEAPLACARQAARALGLRAAAVDLFAGGDPNATAIIEVNANPSIRMLEQSGRGDLILKIWHHTLSAMGLLIV